MYKVVYKVVIEQLYKLDSSQRCWHNEKTMTTIIYIYDSKYRETMSVLRNYFSHSWGPINILIRMFWILCILSRILTVCHSFTLVCTSVFCNHKKTYNNATSSLTAECRTTQNQIDVCLVIIQHFNSINAMYKCAKYIIISSNAHVVARYIASSPTTLKGKRCNEYHTGGK